MRQRLMTVGVLAVVAGCGPSAQETREKNLRQAEAAYREATDKLISLGNDQLALEGQLMQAQVFVENAQRLNDPERAQKAQAVLTKLHAELDGKLKEMDTKIAEQKKRVDEAKARVEKYK